MNDYVQNEETLLLQAKENFAREGENRENFSEGKTKGWTEYPNRWEGGWVVNILLFLGDEVAKHGHGPQQETLNFHLCQVGRSCDGCEVHSRRQGSIVAVARPKESRRGLQDCGWQVRSEREGRGRRG